MLEGLSPMEVASKLRVAVDMVGEGGLFGGAEVEDADGESGPEEVGPDWRLWSFKSLAT